MGLAVDVAHRSALAAWGAAGPVALVLWREISIEGLRGFAAFVDGMSKSQPGGFVVLSLTGIRLKPPSAEVRQEIVAMTHASNMNPGFRGASTVLLGEGFVASIARAAIAGMALMGGKVVPDHVAKNIDEGADYLAPRVGLDPAAVRAAGHAFYTAVGP